MNAKEVMDRFAMEFVKQYIGTDKEMLPQVIISRNNQVGVFVLAFDNSREIVRGMLKKFKLSQMDWLIHMTEAYSETWDTKKNPDEYVLEIGRASCRERV